MKRALLFALGLATANAVCIPKSSSLLNLDEEGVGDAFELCLNSCPTDSCEEVVSLPDCVPSVESLIGATEVDVDNYRANCANYGDSATCVADALGCDWVGESGGASGSDETVVSQVVQGCTDVTANNYDAAATVDDGSCTYPVTVLGCTDAAADNFDANATEDDGSCTYAGCTDAAADNFDANANTDDGSCYYHPGCTDPAALNYDSTAITDDGSCTYPVSGCTDPAALNYDANAITDDGSCTHCLQTASATANQLRLAYQTSGCCGGEGYTTSGDGCLATASKLEIVDALGELEGCTQQSTNECSDLFISEVAEGSSNNKYVEIFNPTNEVIDLTGYALARVNNSPTIVGEYEYWDPFPLSGATILPGDVYVVCHGAAEEPILSECDKTLNYLSNGDDGLCLAKGTEDNYTCIDRVGDFDGDPGSGWEVAGISDATVDHTLVRKSGQCGESDWTVSAGTNTEDSQWFVMDMDDWSSIGEYSV